MDYDRRACDDRSEGSGDQSRIVKAEPLIGRTQSGLHGGFGLGGSLTGRGRLEGEKDMAGRDLTSGEHLRGPCTTHAGLS